MDIRGAMEWQKSMAAYFEDAFKGASDYIFAALKELEQYREIGTIDECREAREKQVPRKPEKSNMQNICPECSGKVLMYYDYCAHCGQAIDWSGDVGEPEGLDKEE